MPSERYPMPDGVPLDPVRPGTVLLVASPAHAGGRDLTLATVAGAPDDSGAIFVTTDENAPRLVEDCEALGASFDDTPTTIVDCVDGTSEAPPNATVLTVSSPQDLTGIGMRFSNAYRSFQHDDVTQVRSGVVSLSTMLSLADFRQVSRFTHTLAGRIRMVDGLGAFLVDPTTQDERVVNTISQFCDGRIDVRDTDAGRELRTRGLTGQPRDWTPFGSID